MKTLSYAAGAAVALCLSCSTKAFGDGGRRYQTTVLSCAHMGWARSMAFLRRSVAETHALFRRRRSVALLSNATVALPLLVRSLLSRCSWSDLCLVPDLILCCTQRPECVPCATYGFNDACLWHEHRQRSQCYKRVWHPKYKTTRPAQAVQQSVLFLLCRVYNVRFLHCLYVIVLLAQHFTCDTLDG